MRYQAASLAMLCLCLCLGTVGCALFDKNKQSGSNNGSSSTAPNPGKERDPLFGGPGSNARANPPAPAASATSPAILAGRVVDSYDKGLGNAHIRLVRLDEKDKGPDLDKGDMSVNPDGSFIIESVKPGGQYKLIARAKNGERMLAGISQTTAPNGNLLIVMREDFANAETPPVPGPPSPIKPAPKTSSIDDDSGPTPAVGAIAVPFPGLPASVSEPNPAPTTFPRGTTLAQDDSQDLPMAIMVPVPNGTAANGWTQPAPAWTPPPNQASAEAAPPRPNDSPVSPPWQRPLEIQAPKRKASEDFTRPVPAPAPPLPSPRGSDEPPPPNLKFDTSRNDLPPPPPAAVVPDLVAPARVPSCVVDGRQLVNFSLYQLNGNPWEYRNKTGKIVLLDFWGTWCNPCLQTIPKLRDLKSRYGSKGLEVVGIACREQGPVQAQAQHVNAVCLNQRVNYRQLLSSGPNCPVAKQFDVHSFPTLVLLDENGTVIWRYEARLDPAAQEVLEGHIRRLLNLP